MFLMFMLVGGSTENIWYDVCLYAATLFNRNVPGSRSGWLEISVNLHLCNSG